MEDIFLSFGFRLGVWILLAISALGVLGLYWVVRRREQHVDLIYTYQEATRLCNQKTEEQRQLERQVRDFDERKAERDRYLAEETRAKEWLGSQSGILRDIQEQNLKLGHLRDQYQEYEQYIARANQLKSEQEDLHQQIERLRTDRDKVSSELKESSNVYLTLIKELDQRKTQLEQFRDVQTDLKQVTEDYMRISKALEQRRGELEDHERELEQLRARAERFKMENPYLADHQELIAKEWKSLEGQYQEVIANNRQQWESLEDRFKRLRDQAQRSTSSLSL